jgi:hypothetical protein
MRVGGYHMQPDQNQIENPIAKQIKGETKIKEGKQKEETKDELTKEEEFRVF